MIINFKKIFKNSSGFTLVEIMLAALLMAIIVGLASLTYFNSINSTETTLNIATSITDARTAMYRITKDLREISSIEEANSNELRFNSNVDNDEDFELVHYYLESDSGFYNLFRKVDSGDGKIVATNVISSEIFEYFANFGDASLSVPIAPEELGSIKNITISLIIDQEETTEGNRTMNLATSITLRNRV